MCKTQQVHPPSKTAVPWSAPGSYELGTEGTGIEAARQKLSAVLPRFHVMLTTYEVRCAVLRHAAPCIAVARGRAPAADCLCSRGSCRASHGCVGTVMECVQHAAGHQQHTVPLAGPC